MGRKKQLFRPNALEEGVSRASRWRPAGTGMCEMTDQRSLLSGGQTSFSEKNSYKKTLAKLARAAAFDGKRSIGASCPNGKTWD